MNREIRFKYYVVRENGFIFSKTFDIRDIELGLSESYLERNHAGDISKVLKRCLYTGLKDKNNNPIFEGDIVKCSYFKMAFGDNMGAQEVDAELIGVVEFNGLSLCLSNIVGEKWEKYTGYEKGEGGCEFAYLHDVYESSSDSEMSIEIIGNIFENPELL